MELGLRSKRALVTAASRGLGRAVAKGLAGEGCRVVLASRDVNGAERAAEEIRREIGLSSGAVTGMAADVTKASDIRRLVRDAAELLGGLDILVTNAGGPPPGRFDSIADEVWMSAVELNLMSVVRLVREVLPHFRAQGGGRILNVSSTSVRQPIPDLILSNTVRTGTMAMLKTLALELAPENITVHNLAPGRIDTDRVRSLDLARAAREGRSVNEVRAEEESRIPLKRYGTPEEYARVAVFLLSPANSYMTGETVFVDGGFLRSL